MGGECSWRFLRQVSRSISDDEDATLDVFFCTRCLGHTEIVVEIQQAGPAQPRRPTVPMKALGTAVRG